MQYLERQTNATGRKPNEASEHAVGVLGNYNNISGLATSAAPVKTDLITGCMHACNASTAVIANHSSDSVPPGQTHNINNVWATQTTQQGTTVRRRDAGRRVGDISQLHCGVESEVKNQDQPSTAVIVHCVLRRFRCREDQFSK